MVKLPTLLEMLQSGLHFGHQSGKWHPKMEQYLFAEKSGLHIIDLEKTQVKLDEALKFVHDIAKNGGVVLFVGTKDQARDAVLSSAVDCGMPYITNRWLGGTLTNIGVILKLTKKLKDLKAKQETGGFKGYTKKEQLGFGKEIEDLQHRVGGIAEMKKTPEAVYVVDVKKEKTAVAEANKKGVPIIAIGDTNINPDKIDYIIPGNDDATKGIELITTLIAEAIKEGKAEAGK